MAGIGHNAGTFVTSTKNADDNIGFADIQKVRFNEPPLRRITEQKTRDNQPVEANEVPPIRRLDGEVVREGDIAFAGGMHFEVWIGRWEKGGRKEGGEGVGGETIDYKEASGEKVGVEKVGSSPAISIPLIWLFVGGLESVPNAQVTREGA